MTQSWREPYANPAGKDFMQLWTMLYQVFEQYPEYHEGGFDAMVAKFAAEDFYNMHFVAKAYLENR